MPTYLQLLDALNITGISPSDPCSRGDPFFSRGFEYSPL